MTEEDLRIIEDRESMASSGPWHVGNSHGGIPIPRGKDGELIVKLEHRYDESDSSRSFTIDMWCTWEDGEFIAYARQDVPALCREVRRCWKEIYDLKQWVRETVSEESGPTCVLRCISCGHDFTTFTVLGHLRCSDCRGDIK